MAGTECSDFLRNSQPAELQKRAIGKSVVKPSKPKEDKLLKEVDPTNEVERRAGDKTIQSVRGENVTKNEEDGPTGIAEDVLVDVVGYVYPVDFMILDIREDEKRHFILGTPFLTSTSLIEKRIKNDIEPIAPTITVNRLVLEWEEKIKLHQEKEMKFNQWRSKIFNYERPASVKEECEVKDKGEVTKAYLLKDKQIPTLGWHLEEIHMTWAQLEKKRRRLRLYTKYFEKTVHTERGDGIAITMRRRQDFHIDGVRDLTTTSEHAALEIKHWGPKRQLFYRAHLNRFSKYNVYSPLKILSVVSVKVDKLHGYGYLEEIMVRRVDRQLYKFKEGDFVNLHLNDIEDMLLLVVQHKLFHLDGEVIFDLAVALRMFTRSLIIKKRVEDVQLGAESYQKKLNITKPQKDFP
ncbi:hypothetical protein Tco_1011679, partial [Tanacetum coccineum]